MQTFQELKRAAKLDLPGKMIDSSVIAFDEFFFNTDVHLSSKAEFAMADLLTQYLTEKIFDLFSTY